MTLTVPRLRSDTLAACVLGTVYFGLAALPLMLTRFDGGVAFIWVATAVLTTRLLLLPLARWRAPLIACGLASALATSLFGLGPRVAPLLVAANLGEAVLGVMLLRRAGAGGECFQTVRGVAIFVGATGLLAPVLGGLLGAGAAWLAVGASYGQNLVHWSAGHAIGTLTVVPVAMLIAQGDVARWRRRTTRREAVAAAAMLLAVGSVIVAVFAQERAPMLFLPMLPMVAATIMLGRFGAAGSTLLLTAIGGVLSMRGHGPVHLMQADAGTRVLFFQGYVGCATMLVLPVAALLREHRALVRRLSESEAKYRVIAERTGDAVIDVAADGTIRYASPTLVEVTGFAPSTLVGVDARNLVDPADREMVWRTHLAALADGGRVHAAEYRSANDDARWHEVSMRAVVAGGVAIGVIGSIRDVSERKAAEQELAIQARTDPLTGLANLRAFRTALDERVARAAQGGRTSVALFDLDRFKAINDRYGHAAGDAVIRTFADIARTTLRSADCIGRIGGEEFAVLLSDVSPIEAAAAGDRLRRALRATPIAIDGGEMVSVTVSVGVATVLPGLDADAVLRAADSALYRAKASGRDCLRRAA